MPEKFESLDPHFRKKVHDSFSRQGFMQTICAKITQLEAGYCEISVPFSLALSQQHGFFHAGITGTIADNSCGYSAYSLMPQGSSVLSVEYKINLMNPAEGSVLISRAKVIKPGKNLYICQAEVFIEKNGIEKLCAICTATIMAMHGKLDHRKS